MDLLSTASSSEYNSLETEWVELKFTAFVFYYGYDL
jgi:hypothetical protein